MEGFGKTGSVQIPVGGGGKGRHGEMIGCNAGNLRIKQ